MHSRRGARALVGIVSGIGVLGLAGTAAGGPTNLQETSPVVWVMVAISLGGALITYAFLAYAIYRYRDQATRKRPYG